MQFSSDSLIRKTLFECLTSICEKGLDKLFFTKVIEDDFNTFISIG